MKMMKKLLAVMLCLILALSAAGIAGVFPQASAKEYTPGETVTFGRWPTSLETNTTVISNLNKSANANMWKTCGYYSGTATESGDTDTFAQNISHFGKMTDKTIMQYVWMGSYFGVKINSLRPYNTVLKEGLTKFSNQDENALLRQASRQTQDVVYIYI